MFSVLYFPRVMASLNHYLLDPCCIAGEWAENPEVLEVRNDDVELANDILTLLKVCA
jgi:hypothetical protein